MKRFVQARVNGGSNYDSLKSGTLKSGTLNPEAWVLDPTIVADNCEDLNTEHVKKCDKYSNLDVRHSSEMLDATSHDRDGNYDAPPAIPKQV